MVWEGEQGELNWTKRDAGEETQSLSDRSIRRQTMASFIDLSQSRLRCLRIFSPEWSSFRIILLLCSVHLPPVRKLLSLFIVRRGYFIPPRCALGPFVGGSVATSQAANTLSN